MPVQATAHTGETNNDTESNWIQCGGSPQRRKRRKRRHKQKQANKEADSAVVDHDNDCVKNAATKPKHKAPPNASTIYCNWYQEGLCHRGKNCYFIHELDPLSDKNPIEHRKMIKQLLTSSSSAQVSKTQHVQVELKPPPAAAPPTAHNQNINHTGFVLPSQNHHLQQQQQQHRKQFAPVSSAFPSYAPYHSPQQPMRPMMPYPFVPSTLQTSSQHYNPYLTVENASTANPYELSSDFHNHNNHNQEATKAAASRINMDVDIRNNPHALNEEDHEIWEDEHGEIIVVEKDQLYGDDPYYHDQKMLKHFNAYRQHSKSISKSKVSVKSSARTGLGSGGESYTYGAGLATTTTTVDDGDEEEEVKLCLQALPASLSTTPKPPSHSRSPVNPDYDPTSKICQFWLHSSCAYDVNCKLAHRFSSPRCPHCHKACGASPLIQQQHLRECAVKVQLDDERKLSESMECAICRENIVDKGSKFGLLTGCTHAFCLQCIREWRGVLGQSKEVVRACPVCRQTTWFIVPSHRFVTDAKRKQQVIEEYKQRMAQIRCKHFDSDEQCPFGSSCFYKHVRKNGTLDDKKVKLRHLINANGETEVMKQMTLSQFLFPGEQ